MNRQKAIKKLGIELPEKYVNNPTQGVYDLYLANPPKITHEQFKGYLDLTSSVSNLEMLRDFADFLGLTDLAEWTEEKILPYTPQIMKIQRPFL